MKKKVVIVLSAAALVSCASVASIMFFAPRANKVQSEPDQTWGHYSRLNPTLNTAGSQEFWISCDTHEIVFEEPALGQIEDRGAPTLEMVQSWAALDDGRYIPKWRVDETHISFGMYPTSKVTDSDTIDALTEKLSIKNPSADSHQGWEAYDFYAENTARNDLGYYQDLHLNGKYYRAVYNRYLRPYATNSKAEAAGSQVDDNGYSTLTLYFFEFTPIHWKVLEEGSSSIKMMATTILDTWQYDHGTSVASFAVSDMHSFLNSTFYANAFPYSQDKLLNVEDNDKVTILSLDEAKNVDYGFTDNNSATATRQFARTDYAVSQGNFGSGNYGVWAVKSLASSNTRYTILNTGAVDGTNRNIRFTSRSGVLPVVSLSKN